MIRPVGASSIDAVEVRTCHLCWAEGERLLSGLRDTWLGVPGAWSLYRCRGCQLVWLDPRPQRKELGKLYGEQYYTHSLSSEADSGTPGLLRRIVSQAFLSQTPVRQMDRELARSTLERLFVRGLRALASIRDVAAGSVMWIEQFPGELLDVGCGNGQFLVRMRDLGWRVKGVEPDPAAAEVATTHHHLDVTCGAVEDTALPAESFNVVTMSHVIEHVHDPVQVLNECRRLLKPGGRLILVTPNIRSLGRFSFRRRWLGWDVPRHLFVFSRQSLRACVERAGLEVEELRTTARASFRQLPSMPRFIRMQQPNRDRARIRTLLFWLLEHVMSRMVPCGEEILLIARRTR